MKTTIVSTLFLCTFFSTHGQWTVYPPLSALSQQPDSIRADVSVPALSMAETLLAAESDYSLSGKLTSTDSAGLSRFIPFSFNHDGKAESYPFVTPDGLEMYFVHNQEQD